MYKLDKKDRKLLFELDLNCRQSLQQLAKKIGLSKDAVKYRMNKLIDAKIIKSFNAVIDTGKLNLMGFRLLLKFYNLTPEKEEEITNHLLKNKHFLWATRAEGNWDMTCWFPYKSINEFYKLWEELLEKYRNYIEDRAFSISNNILYFSRDFLVGNKTSTKKVPISSLPEDNQLDKSELKILELLSNDARMSIVDLSIKTKLNPKTVVAKIKSLEKRKIIVAYRPEFDMNKLGHKYYKFHISIFNTTPVKLKQLRDYFFAHPNVVYWDELIGGYDVEIDVQLKDEAELRDFINQVRSKFSGIIKSYDILRYYKEIRERYFPTL